jgi:hypothetical protein
MKRPVDPVIKASNDRGRLELRNALTKLVERFGYSEVKHELLLVKRSVKNKGDVAGQSELDRIQYEFQKMSHIWLCVEEIRRAATPEMTAKDACAKLAEAGGISFIDGGNPSIGVSYRIASRKYNASTIEREYKRAEQTRRNDENIAAVWENMLADRKGQAWPHRMESGWKGPAAT